MPSRGRLLVHALLVLMVLAGAMTPTAAAATAAGEEGSGSFFEIADTFRVRRREVTTQRFNKGGPVLVVNVASQCGYTESMYKGLTRLDKQYRKLTILAFPCNAFGGQEPQDEETIRINMRSRYGVKFPIAEKVEVNGPDAHGVFKWLHAASGSNGEDVPWNFTVWLIDHTGRLAARYDTGTPFERIEAHAARLVRSAEKDQHRQAARDPRTGRARHVDL